MKIYRAVSQQEFDDYNNKLFFDTGINTLEAKQFFISAETVRKFFDKAVQQDFNPPTFIYLQ